MHLEYRADYIFSSPRAPRRPKPEHHGIQSLSTTASTGRGIGFRHVALTPYPEEVTWRRIIALAIDWGMSIAISYGFFNGNAWATLGVFFLMRFLLTATLGTTFGKKICGLQIRNTRGQAPGFSASFIRNIALCLVIPAGVVTADGRGMHDVWAGTHQELNGAPDPAAP